MSGEHRGQQGMTLIEVIVASTILLVGIASTFAVMNSGQRLGRLWLASDIMK